MPLALHSNQERIRPQLEHLAELARDGDKQARDMLTNMGIAWKGAAPVPSPPGTLRLVNPAESPKTTRRALEDALRPDDAREYVRQPGSPLPPAGVSLERRISRMLFLACLFGLACRYVAWSLADALAYFRH